MKLVTFHGLLTPLRITAGASIKIQHDFSLRRPCHELVNQVHEALAGVEKFRETHA